MVSNGSLWTVPDFRGKAKAMQARGGQLVVIDPRRTETAALADQHLFIRPGSDVFLLLGIVHALFAEGLVRLGRLAPHVAGARGARGRGRRVRARARGRALRDRGDGDPRARAHARDDRARRGVRPHRHVHAGVRHARELAVDVINVLTGHLDEPGGAMFPKAAAFAANTARRAGPRQGHHDRAPHEPRLAARPRSSASCR